MITLEDEQVITMWKCSEPQNDDCKEMVGVDVMFFQDNGTPVCCGCDRDMEYDHTYLNRDLALFCDEQREMTQDDLITFLDDAYCNEVVTKVCQIVVDRFNLLKSKITGK